MNNNYLLRMKCNKANGVPSPFPGPTRGGEWEVRPGGMLVQKRTSDSNHNSNQIQNIKVRVRYGSSYHELVITSQATFGELKIMLVGPTGLHMQDQKLIYKEKERDSRSFLDTCGVRNGSKIYLIEDDVSRERRCVESRKNAKSENATKEIAAIRFEVDKLAKEVASMELEINGGKKVVETVLLSLIEMLMTQLIKLDAIAADGDVKLQRRMQVKRVQNLIETLDVVKIRNSQQSYTKTYQKQQELNKHGNLNASQVVVTTKWETF